MGLGERGGSGLGCDFFLNVIWYKIIFKIIYIIYKKIDINDLVNEMLKDENIQKAIGSKEIFLIKDTKILELLRYFLDNPKLVDSTDEEDSNYLYHISQVGKTFENFFNETYVMFDTDNNDIIVNLITINLEKRLKEFLDKNKVFVMMSGTIHSESVLKEVFGIKEFKIIEAETKQMGKITKISSNLEKIFDYQKLKQEGSREQYLKALSKCIELAKKPVLVQVNAFSDLPTQEECLKYNITNLRIRDELDYEQKKFKKWELVQDFKNGKIDILYSTKCTRGVDFPGEICNSIVFTKYPYPAVNGLFWRVLKKSKPRYYGLFYVDKARRECLQRIYRGLRSQDDHVNLLSPDLRVLNSFI